MITRKFFPLGLCLLAGQFFSCSKEEKHLFRLVPPTQSGIDFNNQIFESDTFNILTEEYIYNGGAVAIADFNKDSLPDVFFSGNMVPNRLYLNKGKLSFQDVSTQAGIQSSQKWNTGTAIADVNLDGWPDIYVCATMKKDPAKRINSLFIHQGLKDGVPIFEEQAEKFGVAENGYSMNAAFLDYDLDGDLDLYVLNNILNKEIPSSWRNKVTDGSAPNNDQLYRNNGDGTFTNVTKQAGIVWEGYGLGIAVADYNNDRYPDIYISNDYMSNDLLYMNNGDGTFTNRMAETVRHHSMFSMGNDAADINNDGWVDIMTLDMLPEEYRRKKTTIQGSSYTVYLNNEKWGYQYQHVRNMLQINNGIGVNQPLSFSEVGSLAEVYETDWSWSALFADYDNDGDKDALITNGFPKDITDKDFSNYRNDVGLIASPWMIVDSIPVVKVSNFAFEATGDLTFKKSTKEWGMDIPSFSNGAAFADLDLDGDLDYVVNNINDPAFIYENLSEKKKGSSNYLRVALKGPSGNPDALGSKIRIVTQGKAQYHDQSIYRGYLSTVESVAHFGLGSVTQVDSLLVRWPDGTISIKTNIAANQVLTLNHTDAKQMNIPIVPASKLKPYFKKEASATLSFKHSEMDKIDYNIQRTLPHKFSQSGPALSVGDVDGNGLEDVVIGGSSEQPTTIFYQVSKSVFRSKSVSEVSPKPFEDEGLLLFDADNDNDLDLYIVSGSFEYEPNSPNYQDRLYRNDGSGNLVRDSKALPALTSSGSCVRAADFDQDGVLDLMVGGRIIPGQYPLTPVSYLLRNNNGLFEDVTDSLCPQLKKVGMVSDAIWTDFNDDGKVDLLVVGEFMAPTFFTNTGSKLEPLANSGLENYSGWWMSVTGGDFDNDGDTDYVVGNVGTNNYFKASVERPLRVYAKDIDGNGSADAVLSCYFISPDGSLKEYPVHFWDELSQQSPKFRRKFSKYRSYAARTMDNLFTEEEKKDMVVLQANWLSSSLILNEGNGKFSVRALPKSVQRAPMNGMTSMDVNSDGFLDIVSVGNDYGNEVFMGRYDAGTGDVLIGDGRGNFKNIVSRESGLFVPGDAKALVRLPGDDKNQLLISQNKDSLKVFSYSSSGQNLPVGAQDAVVRYELPGAKKVKLEVYYGSGFGSQSSRLVTLPLNATKITIQDYKGAIRDANQVVVKK